MKKEPLTLTIAQVADALGISRNSAYVQVHAGTIPHLKLGRRILVSRAQLDKMLGAEPTNGQGAGRPAGR